MDRAGDAQDPALEPLYRQAVRDTLRELEATGSPMVTDVSSASITTS